CCETYLAGYDYAVLNNVFLYRKGFLDKSKVQSTELIDDETSKLLYEQFKEDTRLRYSDTSRKFVRRNISYEIQADDGTEYAIQTSPSLSVKNRIQNYLGFPKSVQGEQYDNEHYWHVNHLLAAVVFIEDAINYRTINHKVTRKYLLVYRWFSSKPIRLLHRVALFVNLLLAFIEKPSSFSYTSDVRYQPHRYEFSRGFIMFIEILTLGLFSLYIATKISFVGIKHARRKFWIVAFFLTLIYSICEWFAFVALVSQVHQGIRLRRIFRPIFMIESSQLIKKALKSVQKDSLTIIACIVMALTHILFFAVLAMFLFPRSDASIINSQLRRRSATRAAYEILTTRMTYDGRPETKEYVPISIIRTVINTATMKYWHRTKINEKLATAARHKPMLTFDEYSDVMKILDLNPSLSTDLQMDSLGSDWRSRLKSIGRSMLFDRIGTIMALISVILVTVEVNIRHFHVNPEDTFTKSLPVGLTNLGFMIYFCFEFAFKIWAFGYKKYVQSTINIFETIVACTCLNIRIVVGTVVDEFRNGGAFFGVLLIFYYFYAMIGMEIFNGSIDQLYAKYNSTNITVCGSYEQLEYWPNNFNDFYSSIVTLYHIMIVNQWYVFVNGFRDSTNSRWSELYFIFWYIFVTTIGLNICLALSADIHDAKKQRADANQELIVSNMFDIYRSQLNEPSPDEITRRLEQHPYIKFYSNEIIIPD
ncbi:unnamed protein product, partial [Didymodactylos carnosus]